jgi:hypothetical protein
VDTADKWYPCGSSSANGNSDKECAIPPLGPGSRRTPGGRVLRVRYLKSRYSTDTTRAILMKVKSAMLQKMKTTRLQTTGGTKS